MIFGLLASLAVFGFSVRWVVRYARRNAVGAGQINAGFYDITLLAFIICVVLLAGMTLARIFAGFLPAGDDVRTFSATIIAQIFFIAGIVVFRKFSNARFSVFGSVGTFSFKSAIAFSAAALAVVFSAAGATAVALYFLTGKWPMNQDIVLLFSKIENPAVMAAALVSVVVLAPVAEEMIFRSILYRLFKAAVVRAGAGRGWAVFLAALAASLLFAAAHGGGFVFFPLVCMGMVLVAAYEKCGNLYVPIVVHMVFNILNAASIIAFK